MVSSSLPNSKKMRKLKDDTTRLLFYILCVRCDDDGKMDADPEDIRADYFGGRDKIKIQNVDFMLTELAMNDLIIYYEDKTTSVKMLAIPKWKKYNKISKDRYQPSEIPCYSKEEHNMLPECLQNVNKMSHSIEESSIEESSIVSLSSKHDIPYEEIINDLNLKAKTNYKHNSVGSKKLIKARWNDGFTLDNFKTVHTNMCKHWLNTEMATYVRPDTLYTGKMDSYLNYIAPKNTKKESEYV